MRTLDLEGSVVTTQDIIALSNAVRFYPWISTLNLRKTFLDSQSKYIYFLQQIIITICYSLDVFASSIVARVIVYETLLHFRN